MSGTGTRHVVARVVGGLGGLDWCAGPGRALRPLNPFQHCVLTRLQRDLETGAPPERPNAPLWGHSRCGSQRFTAAHGYGLKWAGPLSSLERQRCSEGG
ncbi:hypothetical protein GGTG_04104 [Gaeumannomyces tritici R3-111a-1]|uniref:Uncharacterized protein n=1 Tax=Gaeumannomyces tritici (strain R3-111a-1) TaxID=644352 RepID=J3NS57_GAET3|nr:hypothetical protein GGTG_04104 [Gaeumannomyces tritici R3-111a-1]EJT79013.1 hypothetical protein GGTG_04104 [Gaeumannomyces tritici R3-111a-1]